MSASLEAAWNREQALSWRAGAHLGRRLGIGHPYDFKHSMQQAIKHWKLYREWRALAIEQAHNAEPRKAA